MEDGYRAFNYGYVRPTGKESSYNNRIKVVRQVYDRIKNDHVEPNYIHTEQPDATRVARPVIAKPINRYDDGGQLDTPKLWDDLSLEEKSDVMASAVRHGITTLPEIKDKWNEFAEGGPLDDTVEDYVNAIYQDSSEEPYGVPQPHYNNVNDAALALLAKDYYDDSLGGNLFKGGGNLYVPSEKIKKEIANWEGASMKTNRSFEDEARDFNRVIPENIRRSQRTMALASCIS